MDQRPSSTQLLALCRTADALLDRGRHAEAIQAYRKLVLLDPRQANAWYNLGYALKAVGHFEDALAAYQGALDAGVADPQEVHLNRASIYSNHLLRDEPAEQELRTALALRPDYAPALLNLGNLHEERGERDAAIACYRKLLGLRGAGADTHRHEALARMAHLTPPEDPADPLMLGIRDAAGLARDPQTRANLWFAAGRAYERLQCTDQAFAAFEQANASSRPGARGYDRSRHEHLIQALIEQFAAPTTAAGSGGAPAPVFICGMFRSGSTLLEQALSAHPAISPGGELEVLPRMVSGPLAPFPFSLSKATDAQYAELAQRYRRHLEQLFPQARDCACITDKRPDNFLLIGLIMRMFPDARILHTVRHPLDNGLSVFMQHLDARVAPYAMNLGDIGHYYAQYRRLMAHWKALYPDAIHDVDYDELVQAPGDVLERALGFLGLPWHPGCLEFHQVAHTVKTASYWQVRQPLYRDASGRWERYVEHLRPLREALEQAGVAAD